MTLGASAILIVLGGGVAGIAVLTSREPRVVTAMGSDFTTEAHAAPRTGDQVAARPPVIRGGIGDAEAPDDLGDPDTAVPIVIDGRTSAEADRTATREPRRIVGRAGSKKPGLQSGSRSGSKSGSPPQSGPSAGGAAGAASAAAQSLTATTTSETETETRPIPFQTQLIRDLSLPRGAKRLETPGVAGEETRHYLVTYVGSQETSRRLLDSSVTREPQQRVIALGSRGRPRPDDGSGPDVAGCLLGRSACEDRSAAATPPESSAPEATDVPAAPDVPASVAPAASVAPVPESGAPGLGDSLSPANQD